MTIDLTKALFHPGQNYPFSGEVEIPPQEIHGDTIRFDAARLEGTLFSADDAIFLSGTLQTTAHGECAVCLSPVDVPMNIPFEETFRKTAAAEGEESEDFTYEGKTLVTDDMATTLILLNLPMRFVCAAGCAASAHLTEWDEEHTVWAEESEDEAEKQQPGTYRPFENLKEMLEKGENL